MPEAFERARRKKGWKVRTVKKGAAKGRLVAVPPGHKGKKGRSHPVLGNRRGE
jgi:hypothetical protein